MAWWDLKCIHTMLKISTSRGHFVNENVILDCQTALAY